jgi:pimeloyl-ACP methyl ester carboxylesterase
MRVGAKARIGLLAALGAGALAAAAPSAGASVRFERIKGYDAPATPAKYDKVGILETGRSKARNVLIMIPGTSASAAYFEPLAKTITAKNPDWQVWSVERRENLLEDQSMADAAKAGKATPQQLFDYYLGYLTNPAITKHYTAPAGADVAFAKQWGMQVAVGDIQRVVRQARKLHGKVVLGGHSLGGSITTAYATWDFGGKAGAKDLSGLVYMDGGSGPPVTADAATASLAALNAPTASPWLVFGGIPAPFAGLFNIVGAGLTKLDPNAPSVLQTWPLLPAFLKGPDRVTNEAGYGFALDSETSPPSLAAAQVHAGHVATSGDPRGWDREGELSPIQRVADAFFGTGLKSLDGTAWFHPQRLTIDAGAVGNGIANPAQGVLDVHATHGADLKGLRIYAFGAHLGGRRVLDSARALAAQSQIPGDDLTLVDRADGYSHVDPVTADPDNDFVDNLTPFLAQVGGKASKHSGDDQEYADPADAARKKAHHR